ncbi:hypothetical protein D5086_002567 [Populus alba]|uniref:Uncharacterized protein n=1 Tax=Populus alba TaxID=43335 RepID=A0ACC4D325_POPAL
MECDGGREVPAIPDPAAYRGGIRDMDPCSTSKKKELVGKADLARETSVEILIHASVFILKRATPKSKSAGPSPTNGLKSTSTEIQNKAFSGKASSSVPSTGMEKQAIQS